MGILIGNWLDPSPDGYYRILLITSRHYQSNKRNIQQYKEQIVPLPAPGMNPHNLKYLTLSNLVIIESDIVINPFRAGIFHENICIVILKIAIYYIWYPLRAELPPSFLFFYHFTWTATIIFASIAAGLINSLWRRSETTSLAMYQL